MFKKFLILIASVVLINQDCAECRENELVQAVEKDDLKQIKVLMTDKPAPWMVPLIFSSAAKNGHKHIMEWLLTKPHRIPLPDQMGVDNAFVSAARYGHKHIMEWLLTRSEIPLPGQNGVNVVFYCAAEKGHKPIMEWLLTRPVSSVNKAPPTNKSVVSKSLNSVSNFMKKPPSTPPHDEAKRIPLPDQDGVNAAFIKAASTGHKPIIEWLLTQPNGIPLPDQDGVNAAFQLGALNGHLDTIKWLLTQPNGIPLPDEKTLAALLKIS